MVDKKDPTRLQTIHETKEFIESLLLIAGCMDERHIDVLHEAYSDLEKNISYNQSVSIVAIACGGKTYDPRLDSIKMAEVKAIIKLVEARKKMVKAVANKHSEDKALAKVLSRLYR